MGQIFQGQTIQVMQKLAVNALGDTVVAHDDVLFGAGDSAEAAYFVQSGRLQPGHQIFQMGPFSKWIPKSPWLL